MFYKESWRENYCVVKMIDELLQFHDKGDEIVQELCKDLGPGALKVDFQYYDNATIEFPLDLAQEITESLAVKVQNEIDIVRKKCLVFLIAKLIDQTKLIPSTAFEILYDNDECPYILYRLAKALYKIPEIEIRCVEVFKRTALNKENHMDMRYDAIDILYYFTQYKPLPSLVEFFIEVMTLNEYYYEDPSYIENNTGVDFHDTYDSTYSEYWIMDLKETAISGLSFFPDQFEQIALQLLKFMTEDYQIEEYTVAAARVLCKYIRKVPYASTFLLNRVDYLFDNNEGAKIIIDEIKKFQTTKLNSSPQPYIWIK